MVWFLHNSTKIITHSILLWQIIQTTPVKHNLRFASGHLTADSVAQRSLLELWKPAVQGDSVSNCASKQRRDAHSQMQIVGVLWVWCLMLCGWESAPWTHRACAFLWSLCLSLSLYLLFVYALCVLMLLRGARRLAQVNCVRTLCVCVCASELDQIVSVRRVFMCVCFRAGFHKVLVPIRMIIIHAHGGYFGFLFSLEHVHLLHLSVCNHLHLWLHRNHVCGTIQSVFFAPDTSNIIYYKTHA